MRKELESSGENGDSKRSAKAGHKRDKWGGKVTTEGRNAAHNPEVVGSNPSPATTKVPKTIGFRNFLFISFKKVMILIGPNPPDPNSDPKAEMGEEVRKLQNHETAPSPLLSASKTPPPRPPPPKQGSPRSSPSPLRPLPFSLFSATQFLKGQKFTLWLFGAAPTVINFSAAFSCVLSFQQFFYFVSILFVGIDV